MQRLQQISLDAQGEAVAEAVIAKTVFSSGAETDFSTVTVRAAGRGETASSRSPTTNALEEGPDKKPNKQPYSERYQEHHSQPFVPPRWPYPSPPHHPIPSLVPYPLLPGSLELPKRVLSPSSFPAHIVHAP